MMPLAVQPVKFCWLKRVLRDLQVEPQDAVATAQQT
jgi:hypothetical protein